MARAELHLWTSLRPEKQFRDLSPPEESDRISAKPLDRCSSRDGPGFPLRVEASHGERSSTTVRGVARRGLQFITAIASGGDESTAASGRPRAPKTGASRATRACCKRGAREVMWDRWSTRSCESQCVAQELFSSTTREAKLKKRARRHGEALSLRPHSPTHGELPEQSHISELMRCILPTARPSSNHRARSCSAVRLHSFGLSSCARLPADVWQGWSFGWT